MLNIIQLYERSRNCIDVRTFQSLVLCDYYISPLRMVRGQDFILRLVIQKERQKGQSVERLFI